MRYKAIDILNLKVVEIVLITGLLISSVALLIDIVTMSSFAVMIGSGSIVLTLVLLLIFKKRWIGNNVTTTALTAFFVLHSSLTSGYFPKGLLVSCHIILSFSFCFAQSS